MKLRNLFIGILPLTALFSCQPDVEPEIKPILELSTEKFVFGSVSDMKVLNITANNDWTITTDVEWLDFSETSGKASDEKQAVNIYSETNEAFEDREGKIIVTAGGLTKEVAVTQKATEFVAELSVAPKTIAATADQGTYTFAVSANVAWTAVADVEWVTLEPAGGVASAEQTTVTVTVAATDQYEVRTAVITVSADDLEETVEVTQEAKVLRAEAMEGQGTEANPYLIKSVGNMLALRDAAAVDATTYFRLENDIDMSLVTNWAPVNFDGSFSRQIHFDGNNKTISNFAPTTWTYLAEPSEGSESTEPEEKEAKYYSLFGVLYGSVKNLSINNVTISCTHACGVIGGYVGTAGKPGLVENVTITNATINGAGDRAGGVCGNAKEATFKNVTFKGSVTSTYTTAEAKSGGFVGHTETSATFENCSAEVTVTAEKNDVGGFVGKITGNDIRFTNCNVKVTLVSKAIEKVRCGGFLGWNSSTKLTMNNCHVLEGSTITNTATWSAVTNGNFGGFIGFGDTTNSVIEITGCSATVDINVSDKSTYNGGFIGGTGYTSTMTLTDCHAKGTVNGNNYVGGFIGANQSQTTINRCSAAVNVTSTGQRVGSFVGTTTNPLTIKDCYSTGNVSATGQQVAGILGYTNVPVVIERCFSAGDVTSNTAGTAGIVGTLSGANSTVSKCIAWNANITCNRASNDKWAPGAIVGAANVAVTLADCYRRADMNFVDKAGAMTLSNQENVSGATPPIPDYLNNTTQAAYHGKAAAANATASSVAKTLGWDETIWDLSGDLPKLK